MIKLRSQETPKATYIVISGVAYPCTQAPARLPVNYGNATWNKARRPLSLASPTQEVGLACETIALVQRHKAIVCQFMKMKAKMRVTCTLSSNQALILTIQFCTYIFWILLMNQKQWDGLGTRQVPSMGVKRHSLCFSLSFISRMLRSSCETFSLKCALSF